MNITVKYFGVIAETTGKAEEALEVSDDIESLKTLKSYLVEKYGLHDPESIQVSVNHSLRDSGQLKNGDEVALLPPFSGG